MTRSTFRRRGNVAVVFALCLVTITGLIALFLDGGLVLDSRRHAQSAADAAAIAAADDLYLNWWTNYGTKDTTTESGKKAALAAAKAMGFEDGVNDCTVEVYILPRTGLFVDTPCHAEVIITTSQDRTFSRLWSTDKVRYGARAVARARQYMVTDGIICLDPTERASLVSTGNGNVTVQNASIQVNSSDYQAMNGDGNGILHASDFNVNGSPGYDNAESFNGTINPNSPQMADPLAYLPPPDTSDLTVQSRRKLTIAGQQSRTLDPGIYIGGISITSSEPVILNPGIYYMQGGGFTVGANANVTGAGVMIYNAAEKTSDVISISGGGTVLLSPSLTGPYKGIVLFQDRNSTAPVSVSGTESATFTITGTFYAASAELAVSGSGGQQTLGSLYISNTLKLTGNGGFTVLWTESLAPQVREILLVE